MISSRDGVFTILGRYGIREDGEMQLAPPRALVAFLFYYAHDPLAALEAEPVMMNGYAWLNAYLRLQTGELFSFAYGHARVRIPGRGDVGPHIPMSPFEQHFIECSFTTAEDAIRYIEQWAACQGLPPIEQPYTTHEGAMDYLVRLHDASVTC